MLKQIILVFKNVKQEIPKTLNLNSIVGTFDVL